MKTRSCLSLWLVACSISHTVQHTLAQERLQVEIRAQGPQLELRWQSKLRLPLSTSMAQYEVQRSDDLIHWQSLGPPIAGRMGVADELLRTGVAPDQPQSYYRLVGQVQPGAAQATGAEVFGYGTAFAQELQRLGQISPAEFAVLYPPPPDYLPQISYDPSTAQYWRDWQSVHSSPVGLNVDFRLDQAELAVVTKYGFVVSERLSSRTFADRFYRIYSADLPVFVSTDAILQAWHFSYQAMLKELEQTFLFSQMQQILKSISGQIPGCWKSYGEGVLKDSVLDADYFITVAESLLAGQQLPSSLGQDERLKRRCVLFRKRPTIQCFLCLAAPESWIFRNSRCAAITRPRSKCNSISGA